MHQPTSRRDLLKASGILAAAAAGTAALPTTAHAIDTAEARPVCFHTLRCPPVDDTRLTALWAEVESKIGFELTNALQDAEGIYWNDQADRFVEAVARHLPGLAPTVRLVARHTWASGDYAVDCCDRPIA